MVKCITDDKKVILIDNSVSKYVEIIKDYMANEVDYAYLLTGSWGSGKTIFVKNILRNRLNECSYDVVHISLFGKTTMEEINREVISSVLFHKRAKNEKIRFDSFFKRIIVSEDSKINLLVGGFSEIVSFEFNKRLEKDEYGKRLLFVFDDIERCDTNSIASFLGAIHSQYSENGYHVLFVADETKLINSPTYYERKEKIIRTTIKFKYLDLKELIKDLILLKKDTPVSRLFLKNTDEFCSFIGIVCKTESCEVENLRIWQASFDYFNMIVQKCDYPDDYPFLLNLYCIVLFTTYYSKTNRELFDSPVITFDEKTNTLEKQIKKEFGIECISGYGFGRFFNLKYQSIGVVKFARLSSVLQVVETGFVDDMAIKSEMESFFPVGSPEELAFVRLYDYNSLSQNELYDCIKLVNKGIENDSFSLIQLIELGNMFIVFEKSGYLNLFDHEFDDYKSQINMAIINIDASKVGKFFSNNKLEGCDYLKYKKDPNFMEEAIDKLAELYYRDDNEEKEYKNIISNIGSIGILEINYDFRKNLIKKARDYNLFPLVLKYSCRDIDSLKMHLNDISRFENSGQIYGTEIEPLKELKLFLENTIHTIPNSKQRIELELLIQCIKTCISKLEGSKGSSS